MFEISQMDSKLEHFPCLVIRYDWNFYIQDHKTPFFLSKKLMHQTNYILRVGLKIPYGGDTFHRSTLFWLTTNFNKMGLKIKMVSFTLPEHKEAVLMGLKTITDMDETIVKLTNCSLFR